MQFLQPHWQAEEYAQLQDQGQEIHTLLTKAVALESPVSCSEPSTLVEPDFADAFSEELKDDSTSIIGLLFTGEREIGLDMLFCFPSEDWKAITWILPT